MPNARIIGTGSTAPKRTLTNKELESIVDTTDEWITRRTGIKQRHISSTDAKESTTDMATQASNKALRMAGVSASDLDMILVPVGGGGLLSGTAIAAKGINANIKVIGCEPENADDAYRSFQADHIVPSANPNTIADGLRTSLGDKTFPIISEKVDDIVLVSETDIIAAMKLVFERMKIVIEPSAAVPLGALLGGKLSPDGQKIGVILSGGNIDLTSFFETLG